MFHDEISWQDVLFEGFEVLVTAALHNMCGLVVRLTGRSNAGSCPSCGRAGRYACAIGTSADYRIFR